MSEIKDKLCWHFNGERMISESDHLTALKQAKIDAVREFAEFVISRNPRSVVSTEVGYRLEQFEQLKENTDE
jgi:hypothetical protein